ncbi:hypothetical protein GCM10027294_53240 [Marinactinospora endophytica]
MRSSEMVEEAAGPQEAVAPHVDAPSFPRQAYEEEVARLGMWVDGYLVRVWVHSVTSTRPWCAHWREHRDAVSVLHALWLSWQEMIETSQAGSVGPSLWIHTHLRPTLDFLRSAQGPFAACMRGPNRNEHRLPISALPT